MIAGPNATGEQIEKITEALGLNQPLHVQYMYLVARVRPAGQRRDPVGKGKTVCGGRPGHGS
jgi:Binding-prot-dependent transport system membrane comp, N-term